MSTLRYLLLSLVLGFITGACIVAQQSNGGTLRPMAVIGTSPSTYFDSRRRK